MAAKKAARTSSSAAESAAKAKVKVREQPDSLESGSSEERWRRTAIAAYYRAEARGFAPGGEMEDWLAAERELDIDPLGSTRASRSAGDNGAGRNAQSNKPARKRTKPTREASAGAREQGDRS